MSQETERLVLDDQFMQDPHAVYATLKTQGSAHRVMMPANVPVIGGLPVWLITGYEEVRSALADPRLSTDLRKTGELFAQNEPDGNKRGAFSTSLATHMLHSDPPDHDRLRKLVNKAFTSRAIEKLRPEIEQITAELLDGVPRDREVDLLDLFAFPLPIRVICLLLGVPVEDQESFKDWSKSLVSSTSAEEAAAASTAMIEYMRELVERKRQEPTEDVLTALVTARDQDDRLSETELISMAFLLFVGGHETTVNTLGNGLLHLLTNRDQWDALQADRSLVPGAVEEFLRIESPLKHATFRCATEPVKVGDTEIPAGDFVLISLASANRDPDRFGDPHTLDVTRPAGGHVAFGHGIHYCLGAPLARMEAQIAFNALLDRFPQMQLEGAPEDLRWRPSTLIRGLHALPVTVGQAPAL